MIEIYASGFNAHNQLGLVSSDDAGISPSDIHSVTKLQLEVEKKARVLFAGWSSTVCKLKIIIYTDSLKVKEA